MTKQSLLALALVVVLTTAVFAGGTTQTLLSDTETITANISVDTTGADSVGWNVERTSRQPSFREKKGPTNRSKPGSKAGPRSNTRGGDSNRQPATPNNSTETGVDTDAPSGQNGTNAEQRDAHGGTNSSESNNKTDANARTQQPRIEGNTTTDRTNTTNVTVDRPDTTEPGNATRDATDVNATTGATHPAADPANATTSRNGSEPNATTETDNAPKNSTVTDVGVQTDDGDNSTDTGDSLGNTTTSGDNGTEATTENASDGSGDGAPSQEQPSATQPPSGSETESDDADDKAKPAS
jgi:hypothetical protein